MIELKRVKIAACLLCVLGVVITSPRAVAQTSSQSDGAKKVADLHLDVQQYMEILGAAITTLQGQYVDTINWSSALAAGVSAVLEDLDPYCEFYTEEDQSSFKTMTTGEYGGIGALIQQRGDTVIVSNPYEGRPAYEAGLEVGDAILSIEGESMVGKTTQEVSEKLRGQAGTSFHVEVQRPNESGTKKVEITRRKIVLDAVPYYGWLNDSIAYISLSQFTDKAAQSVQDALVALRSERVPRGLVFDLRQNGGGLLEEAVKVVGMFVPKGNLVVETKAKRPEWSSTYRTNTVPIEPTLPLVCLVDRNTASAAEIVSGALQDLDRAVIMGERTFGKGLVQSTRPLPYGTLVKFTTAKYYIPSGRCIQALNYSTGQAEQIPDSLTSLFHTACGREVRDGRGIKPDLEEKPEQMSNLVFYLEREYFIFDYATRYHQTHAEIPPVCDFHLSQEEYEDFCHDVLARKNDSLLTFLKIIDIRHDLDSLKDEVVDELSCEISLRYYCQKGQAQRRLLGDALVKKAALVASDAPRMKALLSLAQPAKAKKTKNKKK